MLSVLCCCLFFLGQSLASPAANQYVDTVIYSSLQTIIKNEKLDPTHLPDYTFDYKDKTFFGTVHGKAEYSEGTLSGLSKVRRVGECDGPRNVSQTTFINCTLSFDDLSTSYKGRVKYGILPKVTINGKGDLNNLTIYVAVGKGFGDRNAKLYSLDFRRIPQMTTDFSGLGPLNGQMKVLENNYKDLVGAEVNNVVRNRFQYAFNLAVSNVPMPVQ